jgi:hypothetical protein
MSSEKDLLTILDFEA